MKYLSFGIILSITGFILSLLIWGVEKSYFITGGLAVFFIGAAVLFSGSMVNGDRMRTNFATETKQDRDERIYITTRLLLLGIPNVVVTLLLYYYLK